MGTNKESKVTRTILVIAAIILIILGLNFIIKANDVKDNYYHSENFSSLNKHVYVGGDAYNYIINSNYFTGYNVLASVSFLCSAMFICTSVLLKGKKENIE